MPAHARRKRVRAAAVAAGFLVAGLVCSTVIAWSIEIVSAWQASQSRGISKLPGVRVGVPDASTPEGVLYAIDIRRFGRREWTIDRALAPPPSQSTVLMQPPSVPRRTPPWWVRLPELGDGRGLSTAAAGIPLVCMASETDRQAISTGSNSGAMSMRYQQCWAWLIRKPGLLVVIPLRPIWPNLLADSAFFGFILASPFVIQSRRRTRRLRRGLCPRCAYDLQGEPTRPCPECGRIAQPQENAGAPVQGAPGAGQGLSNA